MRVVVADDAVLLREGLARILTEDGYDVVSSVGTAPDLVHAARALTPQLVIADVPMPPTHTDDGIVAARQIRRDLPNTAIVLLSQYVEATAAMDLFQNNPAGLGYLLKDRVLQIDDFLDADRRVVAGGTAMDPAIIAQLLGRSTAQTDPLAILTEREHAVLALMVEGLSNTGIATGLHVGVRTSRSTSTPSSRNWHYSPTPTITDASKPSSPTSTPNLPEPGITRHVAERPCPSLLRSRPG